MKKLLILFLFFLLLIAPLNAQSGYMLKAGVNYSVFRNEKTGLKPGITFGICREWHIMKNTAIAGEILIINKKGMHKNITVANDFYDYYHSAGHAADIYCSVVYLDIPFLIKYSIPLYSNFELQLCSGTSFSLSLLDMSNYKRLYLIDNFDRKIKFDYLPAFDSIPFFINNSGFNFNLGVSFVWSFLTLECRYSMVNYDLKTISSINIYEKLNSFHFLIGLPFDNLLDNL